MHASLGDLRSLCEPYGGGVSDGVYDEIFGVVGGGELVPIHFEEVVLGGTLRRLRLLVFRVLLFTESIANDCSSNFISIKGAELFASKAKFSTLSFDSSYFILSSFAFCSFNKL